MSQPLAGAVDVHSNKSRLGTSRLKIGARKMAMTTWNMLRSTLGSLLYLALLPAAVGEKTDFSLLLEPSSDSVYAVSGFLKTPGSIDISGLRVYTPTTASFEEDDDEFRNDGIPSTDTDDGLGGGNRGLAAMDDDFFVSQGSVLDIAIFPLPKECANAQMKCDWTQLGIGGKTASQETVYCCNREAQSAHLCQGTSTGRLLINTDKFVGKHRMVTIPQHGVYDDYIYIKPLAEQKSNYTMFAVAFANCQDNGRAVTIDGHIEWKSKHGYLPGDMFGLMYFNAVAFFLYFGLLLAYGIAMKAYEEENIPIQGWIFGTMAFGCLELFFRTGDLFVWNEDGDRFMIAYYVGMLVGVFKQGISRCLLVMVSLGWGVVRDDLGPVMNKINVLGGLYIAVSLIQEIMFVVANSDIQEISSEEDEELVDIVKILTLVIACINVVFYIWIIDSLNATMDYLENMSQEAKLKRYLRLRCILLFSIFFAVVWSVFGVVAKYDPTFLAADSWWVVQASSELNYIFVLATVAWLWRPQKNAKDYAYVMQLPVMKAIDGDEENELELTDVVPSAADDLDDEIVYSEEPSDELVEQLETY